MPRFPASDGRPCSRTGGAIDCAVVITCAREALLNCGNGIVAVITALVTAVAVRITVAGGVGIAVTVTTVTGIAVAVITGADTDGNRGPAAMSRIVTATVIAAAA